MLVNHQKFNVIIKTKIQYCTSIIKKEKNIIKSLNCVIKKNYSQHIRNIILKFAVINIVHSIFIIY